MTTTERPERSVPKPAVHRRGGGCTRVPRLQRRRPSLQLLQAREAQADPLRGRHRRRPARPAPLPLPGLDLRLRRRLPRLPARLDQAQGLGRRQARARQRPRHRRPARRRLARPRLARVPRPQRRVGDSRSTGTTPTSSGRSTRTSRTPATRRRSSSGPPNWVHFVERNVGAWMHIEHILGLYVFAACNRSGPTNMHNTAMVVNSEHKIRFAQDLALYNLTLTEEIEGFDGSRAPRRVEQRRRRGRASARSPRRSPRSTTTGASRSSPPTSSSSRCSASCSGRNLVHADRRPATATTSRRRSWAPASTTTPSVTCAGPRRASARSRPTRSSPTTTSS